MSQGRRRRMLPLKQGARSLVLFRLSVGWMMPSCIEKGVYFPEAPRQTLIPSGNTLTDTRKPCVTSHLGLPWPVELTCEVDCHRAGVATGHRSPGHPGGPCASWPHCPGLSTDGGSGDLWGKEAHSFPDTSFDLGV